ncbi:uncharacterized protein LOC113227134 [Hyposmocoma kahamanoa]|uniref:uncharacterized protein LOC113227134 n=1 Tax=Hyposmocoma kahamanoa TaxID=1477025 RepID=UPI000E6D6C97|nr:uncharacterized protein LOC113227134 [Hyposmocoma kahamanoa]
MSLLKNLLNLRRVRAQCRNPSSITFARWSGVSPERGAPVFVYSASGDEESLVGACLARCHELEDCAAVVVAYGKGNCHGVAVTQEDNLRPDNDVAYFKKICLERPARCRQRWWAVETTPGYHLHSDGPDLKVIINATMTECYEAVLSVNGKQKYRSAQWVGLEGTLDIEMIKTSDYVLGNCVLHSEDKFTEPESYRVSNYYTFYIENQCRHDYPKKIDRCSYEEYYNQTLKHVELTMKNYTKDECKTICELEDRFVCRGFTWTSLKQTGRGLCDLHSEDLLTTGSWLLRRTSGATYYRRVICLNISVECEGNNLVVKYRPRGLFRGRVYVPGRGEQCSAQAINGVVNLSLPLYGDCDVNFAYAISNGPTGLVNSITHFVIEFAEEAEIEAYHLVASSRLGDSSVLLLDSKGCPTGQVDFPQFSRSSLNGLQRLSARFKAFRFPTSHVVRFALMVRFCDKTCPRTICSSPQTRTARETNDTLYNWNEDAVTAVVQEDEAWDQPQGAGVVAQGGTAGCGGGKGRVPLELEMVVGSRDIISADTLVRADHRVPADEVKVVDGAMVCVHELLLLALALAWLAVQVLLLLGCCVLVNRYRNLAEMNMQKDYHSFDNVGFDTVSTHRRVHWPDQNIDILHS